jgi:hypothetical protein
MKSFKKCPLGHRNYDDVNVCSECSGDLQAAPIEWEVPDMPVAPALPEDGEFRSVAPLLPAVTSGGESVDEEACKPVSDAPFSVSVRVPGYADLVVGEGLLIGRDEMAVPAALAAALRGFRGVSKRHVWFVSTGDGVLVVDQGSKNGTWVGRVKLQPYRAHRVDRGELPMAIWLGSKLELTLRFGGE